MAYKRQKRNTRRQNTRRKRNTRRRYSKGGSSFYATNYTNQYKKMMRGLNSGVFYGDCMEKCKNSCSKKKESFENIRTDAISRLTPEPKRKREEYAIYTNPPDYPSPGEMVRVVERHPEGEGGGTTIQFLNNGRERQTLNENLTFLP